MSFTRINKTGKPQVIPASDGRLTISVPIQIKGRSGRKLVTIPSGAERPSDSDPTPLQLALARGHQWLSMLESGEVKSLRELARREGVDSSYVSRMVNLTTLAPDTVAAILNDAVPTDVTLFDLAVDPPALWEGQRGRLVSKKSRSTRDLISWPETEGFDPFTPNPVRAGVAKGPGQYRWSSYSYNALKREERLVTPHRCYLALGRSTSERMPN